MMAVLLRSECPPRSWRSPQSPTPISRGLAAFAGLTADNAPAVRSQAWKTGIYVFAILTVFAVSGSLIMHFFG